MSSNNVKQGATRIEVFDVPGCHRMEDFDAFIPGIGAVYQTPVLGVFCDGELSEHAAGLSPVSDALRRFDMLGQGK